MLKLKKILKRLALGGSLAGGIVVASFFAYDAYEENIFKKVKTKTNYLHNVRRIKLLLLFI